MIVGARGFSRAAIAVSAFIVVTGCGKSGPPLPPLVKVPVAPANLVAERRGATVDLQFTVPAANTDGTRPANLERVDVYGITGPDSITDEQILKHGTKVAAVAVKAPRDPNRTVEPEDPDAEMEPPEGRGLDQGAVAKVMEEITDEALTPFDPENDPDIRRKVKKHSNAEDLPQPLVGPSLVVPLRTYVGVGVTTRGRKGPLSMRVAVPLVAPPPPPSTPKLAYDETAVNVTWDPVATRRSVQEPGTDKDVLPSTPIGVPEPTIAYNVYDVAPDPASHAGGASQDPLGSAVRLTATPISATSFADPRITWGDTRCYTIRTVETAGGLPIESDAAPVKCTTLIDTFPPAAPKNLQAVPTEGAISLIWDASPEKDLAGYLVLRGPAPGDALQPLTPAPIADARFNDTVKPGVQYAYVVKAVDKAGNVSPPSNRVEESAR